MTAHRFKFEIGGETLHGLAFGSEAELDNFLAGRTVPPEAGSPSPAQASEPEPRPPGRPSKAPVIEQAIAALGSQLALPKLSDRVRLVRKHLAQTVSDPSEIPATRTIRDYLGENPGGNYGEKGRRAKMPRTGGKLNV